MLTMDSRNFNFNATSKVDDTVIATMSASFSGTNVYFNMNVENVSSYSTHKTEVDADYAIFTAEVLESISDTE